MSKYAVIIATTATALAGVLHLFLASQLIFAAAISFFFISAGLLQLFWVVPTIRRWNLFWNYTGIGGTLVLIGIWSLTRFPNPITSRALPVNEIGVLEEGLQIAFVVLLFVISNKRKKELKEMELGQGI